MTEARTVSSQVVVAVDPDTAFAAFTDEMDLWWERSYINFWSDGGRVAAVRCEPGVGGRIVEVLDDPTATPCSSAGASPAGSRAPGWSGRTSSTTCSPRCASSPSRAARASWSSTPSRSTVATRVAPRGAGSCRCGSARGASGATVPHVPPEIARLSLVVAYERPAAATRWLHEVFGFTTDDPPTGDDPLPHGEHGHPWLELRVGDVSFVITPLDGHARRGRPVFEPWVHVDDLPAHFAHAKGHGATDRRGDRRLPGVALRRRGPRGQPLDVPPGPPHHALTGRGRYGHAGRLRPGAGAARPGSDRAAWRRDRDSNPG